MLVRAPPTRSLLHRALGTAILGACLVLAVARQCARRNRPAAADAASGAATPPGDAGRRNAGDRDAAAGHADRGGGQRRRDHQRRRRKSRAPVRAVDRPADDPRRDRPAEDPDRQPTGRRKTAPAGSAAAQDRRARTSKSPAPSTTSSSATTCRKAPCGQKLASLGVSVRTLIDQIRVQLAWTQVLREQLADKLNVTDAEIDEQMQSARGANGQAGIPCRRDFHSGRRSGEHRRRATLRRDGDRGIAVRCGVLGGRRAVQPDPDARWKAASLAGCSPISSTRRWRGWSSRCRSARSAIR